MNPPSSFVSKPTAPSAPEDGRSVVISGKVPDWLSILEFEESGVGLELRVDGTTPTDVETLITWGL